MRRARDAYYTPAWMTRCLMDLQPLTGRIVEPCVGDGAIANVLRDEGGLHVVTNDIDPAMPADYHMDAGTRAFWSALPPCDWAVSNPPYLMPRCLDIVSLALEHARVGIAMMLRISFEEPTAHKHPRGPWLEQHPLSRKFTMPRYSFTGNGSTDSATTAWMLWMKTGFSGPDMLSVYRANEKYAQPFRRVA